MTAEDVARLIFAETKRRGYTRDESIACLSSGLQESGLREDAVSSNGLWRGVYQQDSSYPNRGDARGQVLGFLDRLDGKRASSGASPDIWLNIFWLQQRPGESSADWAYGHGRQAYLTEIKSRIAPATKYYDAFAGGMVGNMPGNIPAYNEFAIWSPSNSPRNGVKVDAIFVHTQEGGGGDSAAENLGRLLADPRNQVSYHYTVSQASDGGVTVVDCVDTDNASWSVLSANARSINLCFAGSRASWPRTQWMAQAKAIDVAAYLIAQDCKKYGIPANVIAPPYTSRIPGISDHRYVTKVLGDGTHTDVGDQFPWDYFADRVKFWTVDTPATPSTPKPVGPADDQLTMRWNRLGGQTLVEAVAEIRDKVTGSNDRGKTGVL